MIAARSHARRSTAVVARAGKDPSSNGGRYYAGKGKYIRDDRGLVSKTGRDDAFTGGFAGGEKGLWAYRDRLTEKNAASALEKKKRARRESRDVSLAKDFGGLAGGFPGGEIGVKSFNATGAVPEPPAPTLGWGPPTLGALAVVCGLTYYTTGELSADALVKTASGVVDAVVNGVNSAAASADAGGGGGRRRRFGRRRRGSRCRHRRVRSSDRSRARTGQGCRFAGGERGVHRFDRRRRGEDSLR